MNSSVCVVTLLFLCLENVAGLICNFRAAKPKAPVLENKPTTDPFSSAKTEPPVQENTPSTEIPEFTNRSEGTVAKIYCESTELYHEWFQGYKNSTSKKQEAIGNIPLQRGVKKTYYVITVERFDHNTVIYCENEIEYTNEDDRTSHDVAKKPLVWFSNTHLVKKYFKTRIQLFDDTASSKMEGPTILPYFEKKEPFFSCEEYAREKNYTFVGVINTTSNMIRTYQTISAHPKFNITHNGTILCCVYYDVSGTADEKRITRHVAKKTLLVYDDSIQQDSLESEEMTSSDAVTGQTGNQTTTICITTAVAGVLILLVFIVICKKRCRKKPTSDSKVLYVDLDLLRNVRPDSISRPVPEEESPYAQIIGVLKPDQ